MKNINFNELEILSPAGSIECFYADINAGANAVYLGLSEFNARMKAQNFTVQNIRDFVRYAHKFGVKVYVTVNTLLEDADFDRFLEMIKTLTKAKVDAFIVQDLGVAHLLKNSFDGITLHASTQMGIHNLNGAKIAERLGFSRIVLSREATLEDIKQIKNNTNLEIEYFVQGALCVAFSGNCYLSSLEKNASGNEGKCLQLCRLPYENNLNQKEAYYLSTRDLSLLENLETLIDAGVTSFKIEGRMRHAGYTATATKIYRDAIEILKTSSLSKEFLKQAENELKISYSRGDYNKNAYLEKTKNEPVIFPDYQNHIGIKIGTVKKVEPFKNGLIKATLALKTEISEGDGLKIINSKTKTQVASLGVGNVEIDKNGDYVIFTKNNFSAGLDVHLTQCFKNENKCLKNQRKIELNAKIKAFAGSPLKITATSNGISTHYESDYILEKATKSPVSENDFKSQFEKLSDTDFVLNSISLETDGIFLPKSKLNEARRQIISKLEEEIINSNETQINAVFNQKHFEEIVSKNIVSNPTNIIILNKLQSNFKPEESIIYVYHPEVYNADDISKVCEILKDQFALYVPTILDANDTKFFETILKHLPKTTLYAGNIGAFNFNSFGHKIIASPLANIKNNYAIKCLNNLQITTICASIEADESFINKNNLIAFESGDFPLMTFAHCPYKAVTKTTCENCKYNGRLAYTNKNLGSYQIRRTKLASCQFELLKQLNRPKSKFFVKNLNYWAKFTCKIKNLCDILNLVKRLPWRKIW